MADLLGDAPPVGLVLLLGLLLGLLDGLLLFLLLLLRLCAPLGLALRAGLDDEGVPGLVLGLLGRLGVLAGREGRGAGLDGIAVGLVREPRR
ncbi:hypothetical protein [Streptomyces syringium]|uniref:hypothetical protein n=1 Tax=Streptomyces syringium TaxID=76729 RepID=UPI0037D8B8C7